jgi:hypothetical protein
LDNPERLFVWPFNATDSNSCDHNAQLPQLAPSYGWNDTHFVTIAQLGFPPLQETNVFTIHIEIDKATQFAILTTEAGFDTRAGSIQGIDHLSNVCTSAF